MIKAVIFDLDDTLVSEREYIISGYCYISEIIKDKFHLVKNQVFSELMNLFEESHEYVFNRFFDNHSIEYTEDMINNLVSKFRNHFPNIHFYDDVIPFITYLKTNGIKVGIITDGYTNAQQQKLKSLNADNYFDEIILTDMYGREYWKPHPKAFEIMKERLEVEFDEMIFVGDNPEKDFFISNIYPIKTVRIFRNGIHMDKDYFGNVKENYHIDNLKGLFELIL